MVKNRDQWTVTDIHIDRSIMVAGRTGSVRLPADYVANDVRLGYAQTSHATQGRTVDTGLLLVDTPTDHSGIYTPMTRGRQANHAYVVTEDNQAAVDVLVQAVGREWVDQPAVARRLELCPDEQRPIESPFPADADEIDELVLRARRRIAERDQQRRRSEHSLFRGV